MNRLVIAVDCDDVLVPCTEYLVREYNRLFGTRIGLESVHAFNVDIWGADREEVHRRLDFIQLSEGYAQIVPYDGVVNAVKRLATYHDLHMVTARPEAVMGVTQKMIERYFAGCFVSIRHVGPGGNKGAECAALHADVLIDDNFKHLVSAKSSGTKSRLWFGNYPWQTEHLEPSVVSARCRSWLEVEEEIVKLTTK